MKYMYIAIATIAKPHGLKGSVRVKTDSDFKEERYQIGNQLFIQTPKGKITVTVSGFFEKGRYDVLSFNEFDTIEMVEPLRNCVIEIHQDTRQALKEDTYYFSDLEGLNVYQNNHHVGTVKNAYEVPQGTMLRVVKLDKKEALIPFLKQFVTAVNLDEKRIDITDYEGLI